jgi:hypothetical protein
MSLKGWIFPRHLSFSYPANRFCVSPSTHASFSLHIISHVVVLTWMLPITITQSTENLPAVLRMPPIGRLQLQKATDPPNQA